MKRQRWVPVGGLPYGSHLRTPSGGRTVTVFGGHSPVDDDRRVIHLIDRGAPSEPWWWHRLPAAGPIASEADTIANRLGG